MLVGCETRGFSPGIPAPINRSGATSMKTFRPSPRLSSLLPGALLAAICVSFVCTALGEIINADRRINWTPGIPGGVPSRNTIFADVTQLPYLADDTGVTDASIKIQSAINACPAGKVVYIPAGTYRLNNQLAIPKGIVVRGAGPSRTFLQSYAAAHAIIIGNYPSAPVATDVSGSPAKDATSLTVASIASPALSVGDYIVIDQINDGVEVINVDDFSRANNTRCLSQITKVTAISGTGPFTLTISPSLHHAYAAAQSPQVWKLNQNIALTVNAGLENLTIQRISPIDNVNGYSNILVVGCVNSWIKNIESRLADFRHVDLDRSINCEVRDSYFNDGYFQETGGYSYGVVCSNRSTDNLIENNVFRHLRHSMVVKEGATGNVYGYNYSFDTFQDGGWLAPDMFVHGAHANMNLFEGNYGTKIDADFTHGSGSYNTYFRNHVTRASSAQPITGGRWPVNYDVTQSNPNFVGNVLGRTGQTWTALETGTTRNTSSNYVWSWGFRGDGDTNQDSTTPKNTALRHGNYDAFTQTTTWDPTIADQTLPASLYLTSKPAFFGNRPWPSIGPDLSPMVGVVPARARYGSTSIGDFDGDGQPDVLWENILTGDRCLWLMGGACFSSAAYIGSVSTQWHIAGAADFNTDGMPDLVWENTSTGDRSLWLMNGGAFSSTVNLGKLSVQWRIAGIGDFNGDGQPDLVWENTSTGDRYLWLMNGTAYSSSVFIGNVSTQWRIAGAGDFDGDGKTDLVWENTATGDRCLWLMNGPAYSSSVYLGNIATQWQIAGVADFNADGQPDLIWQNAVTGERCLWLMNGTIFGSSEFIGIVPAAWSIVN